MAKLAEVNQTRRAKSKYISPSGVVVSLTPQQKAYADIKLANPNLALTDIVKQSYPNVNDTNLASTVAAQNEKNLSIQIYTNEQVLRAKSRIAELVESTREDIALRSSQDVLDRAHGKAAQKVEMHSSSVSLNIDLTGSINPGV